MTALPDACRASLAELVPSSRNGRHRPIRGVLIEGAEIVFRARHDRHMTKNGPPAQRLKNVRSIVPFNRMFSSSDPRASAQKTHPSAGVFSTAAAAASLSRFDSIEFTPEQPRGGRRESRSCPSLPAAAGVLAR